MQHRSFAVLLLCLTTYINDAWAESGATGAVKIGLLLPLSGPYAAVGADNRAGIDAAVAVSPKTSVEFVTADSKADPTTAVSEFHKLVDTDHVAAVFAMRGPVGMAVNPLSLDDRIPLLGGVGNRDFAKANRYAIQAWSRSDEEGAFLAGVVTQRGLKRVALITAQDDWPSSVSKGFRDAYQRGGSIVFDQDVVPADTDFRTAVAQLKTKSPDMIFANLALGQISPFLKQLKEQSVHAAIYSNFWAAKKEVVSAAGTEAVENVRFVEMDTRLPTLEAHVSGPVSGATLSAYASVLLIEQVVAAKPDIRTRDELAAALLAATELRTPDGVIAIRDRVLQFALVEREIHEGAPHIVSR